MIYQHSKQYELLVKVWETHEISIRQKILAEALDPAMELWGGGVGFKPYFYTDGLWDVLPRNTEYERYCQEHGNEGDDGNLLADIWILVMAESGHPDFLPYIAGLADISVNGL